MVGSLSILSKKDASKSYLLSKDVINHIKILPDGTKILISSFGGDVMIFDFITNIITIIATEKFYISSISCSSNGQYVSVLNNTNKFQIYNITDLKNIKSYEITEYDSSLYWLKDGITHKNIISKDFQQKNLKFFAGKHIDPFIGHFLDVVSFIYSPNGSQLAITNSSGNFEIWCLLTCQKLYSIETIFYSIKLITWSKNFIVIANFVSMCLFNVNTQTLGEKMKIEQNAIDIKISPSYLKEMISILYKKYNNKNYYIIIYDLLKGDKLYIIQPKKMISSFIWSLDGLSIILGNTDGILKLCDLIPKETLFTFILVNRRKIFINKSSKTITDINIKIHRIPEELWTMITSEFLL